MNTANQHRKVRLLINPHSGTGFSLDRIRDPLLKYWETPEIDFSVQFSVCKESGQAKARQAVEDGCDTLLIAGGDGMVNSIGSVLVGSRTALGVIPAGSGNGFARHFNIPLDPAEAVVSLARANRQAIDVGFANGRPFFVTCSLAWDAALVDAFEKFPVRGILPYVFAGVYKFFDYTVQPFKVELDGRSSFVMDDPILCTIANLNQFGGGAQIAPHAKADDGLLQLVMLRQHDLPWIVPLLGKLFDGTINRLEEIKTHSFETLIVTRQESGPMQLDGELLSAPAVVEISVRPRAVTVLVPQGRLSI